MEMRYGNEPTMVSNPSSNEGMNPLESPPRIKRLRNRRRREDSEDSDSDVYSIQFPSISPPRTPSTGTRCDITEYRRRLEIVKERRARHSSRSEATPGQAKEQKVVTQSPSVDFSNTHEEQLYSPITLDESYPSSREASPIEAKSMHVGPLKDSPVSSCQTLDDVTLNTTMESSKIWEQSAPIHPLPSSRDNNAERSRNRKEGRAKNDYLNLRHFMCSSSERNIDTSFAQITDAICKTKRNATADENSKRHYSKTSNGEFPRYIASSSSTAPTETPDNGLLDRLFCSRALSSTPIRTKPKSSFPTSKHQPFESEYESFQDGFPANRTSSPGRRRRLHEKSMRAATPPLPQTLYVCTSNSGKNYHVMDCDKSLDQEQKQMDEIDRTRSISSRKSSSSNWIRKDPWYLRSSNSREGCDELLTDHVNPDNEVMDHVMHAVVFVKRGYK